MRLPLIATLAMLLLAGCGGSSGGGYAQQLSSTLSAVSQPASLDAASLSQLGNAYATAADRLGRLTPPAAVADSHARMVASMRAYADELTQASTLTSNRAAFEAEMARAQTDAQAWVAAFDEIRARGYAS